MGMPCPINSEFFFSFNVNHYTSNPRCYMEYVAIFNNGNKFY